LSVNIHQLSCFELCHALYLTMKGTRISNSYGCRLSAKKGTLRKDVRVWRVHPAGWTLHTRTCRSPYFTRNQFQGINSASLNSLADRYVKFAEIFACQGTPPPVANLPPVCMSYLFYGGNKHELEVPPFVGSTVAYKQS
jgi:hypothetical protein